MHGRSFRATSLLVILALPTVAQGTPSSTKPELSSAATTAERARKAAENALSRLAPEADKRKTLTAQIAADTRDHHRFVTEAVAAEKAHERFAKQKNHDAATADAFAEAGFAYDEAAKAAESRDRSLTALRALEGHLIDLVTLAEKAASDAAAADATARAEMKKLAPSERTASKATLDALTADARAAKKASDAVRGRAGLGTPEKYEADKVKRDESDAAMRAELAKARAERQRVFDAVHATRAPNCDLHRVDFKNHDYEGMNRNGVPLPIRNGAITNDAEMNVFGLPWIIDGVAFARPTKGAGEIALVGFNSQGADAPEGHTLVFDVGSDCTVRYRGSADGFLSTASTTEHVYTTRPRSIAPGGGPVGCIASEVTLPKGKVVQHDLGNGPKGVCD